MQDYPAHLAYLQRGYEAALAQHGYDAVVLCAGSPAAKNRFDDQSWPLNPTPAFAHWCPLREADAYIVVRAGKRPQLVRTITEDFWEEGQPPESEHFWDGFEVVETRGNAHESLPKGKVAIVTRDQGTSPAGEVNPPALIAALDALRTTKTPYEIACLVEASRRAVRGHLRTQQRFTSPCSELEIHLAYLEASEQDEQLAPYQNIVAIGAHAAVLHYVAYKKHKVAGDTSLLVDAGAKYLGYGSDITRTYVRGAGLFADLLAHMEAMQQEIVARIKIGMEYEALHDEAHRMLAVALRELGIGRGSAEELVDRGITRALFPHGLGHSLGITVHDVGMKLRAPRRDNPFLRNTSAIAAGQVFTIEPGIYVIDPLLAPLQHDDRRELLDWAAIAALRPFGGIRIEDNILVEPVGVRNLTREAFASAA